MRHDVLVVEDEAGLLRGIVRGLGADPTIHVEGVETVDRAEEVLDSSPPDLLITDIRLPGRSGLDLLLELEKRALRIPVLVMTSYRSAYEDQLASRSGLKVLEKPVPLATLRRLVKEKLQESQTARPLAPFGLEDYLQLASLSRHSLRFEISLPDSISGRLEVVDGELWNATCGEATADDALKTMLDSPSCDITCCDLTEQPSDRHFQGSTQGVLLDLARRDDEKRRDEGKPGESTFDPE
ncbi:MAG: response regulator, partial [Actinomycetia bacterium]|nr:response regulator [Actinomycetes bacterium]